jgi:hypothetical protein
MVPAVPCTKHAVPVQAGSTYGASLPFMKLEVAGSAAKFTLTPEGEMTHFFVVTCYAPASAAPLALDATVKGLSSGGAAVSTAQQLAHVVGPPVSATSRAVFEPSSSNPKQSSLQLLQPLLGFSQYEVMLQTLPPSGGGGGQAPNLPAVEYRLTYVPSKFSYTQIGVRAFFTLTSAVMLLAYTAAICGRGRREAGQLWVTALLVLLVALNDPLYILRVNMGGNHSLYVASVFGQILFSGCLFLFWLVYADGMNSADGSRNVCCFYVPKVLLVATYVGVSAVMFVVHGRVPDRINMSDAHSAHGGTQMALIGALCASVIAVGVWLSALVSQAVYRLGWKKVEYIYTEREKSFVGITIVFVILSLCGHLYRAVHGRRGSWMQLQLPFLTLTNSYLSLLAHAFWPSDGDSIAPAEGRGGHYENASGGGYDDERGKGQSLLDDDDD